jgi:GNAT superfamily N-acetyltransferase
VSLDPVDVKRMNIKQILYNSPEYAQSLLLREAVLRAPLGLELSYDDVCEDSARYHLGLFINCCEITWVGDVNPTQVCIEKPDETREQLVLVGCASIDLGDSLQNPLQYRVRQVAIHPDLQGQGLGRQLMEAAEAYCRSQNARSLFLCARLTVQKFYEGLGYKSQGASFTAVTIPHVNMLKILSS